MVKRRGRPPTSEYLQPALDWLMTPDDPSPFLEAVERQRAVRPDLPPAGVCDVDLTVGGQRAKDD